MAEGEEPQHWFTPEQREILAAFADKKLAQRLLWKHWKPIGAWFIAGLGFIVAFSSQISQLLAWVGSIVTVIGDK